MVLDKNISQKEIIEACRNLKNGKSCGLDGILNEMIKYGQFALLPCLEKLFNLILSTGNYPKLWSQGFLVPIFKSSDPTNPNNYSGITITMCDPVQLGSTYFNCLLYADDVVLMSQSA